jgi:hypothetical protein
MLKNKIAQIIYDELNYVYCGNCRFDFEQDNDWHCNSCIGSYEGWSIFMKKSKIISEKILEAIKNNS